MKFISKIWWQACGVIVCVVIFQIADTGQYFGFFMNQFHPCVQNLSTSFPCYGIYDVFIMGLAVILGLILLVFLVFRAVRFFKKSKMNQ
jgi:uncharacterized membrane protein